MLIISHCGNHQTGCNFQQHQVHCLAEQSGSKILCRSWVVIDIWQGNTWNATKRNSRAISIPASFCGNRNGLASSHAWQCMERRREDASGAVDWTLIVSRQCSMWLHRRVWPIVQEPWEDDDDFPIFPAIFCYNFDQDYDGHSWNLQTPVTYSDFVCTCLMKLSRNFSKRMECGPSCKATACGNRRVQEWRSKQGEAPRLVILKLQTTPYGLFAGQSFKEGAKSLYEEICCCIPFLACLTALTGSLVVIFVF